MGMSASQARFLAITARKSNVEFQGQQVNQQRTSLANESSGLFNQMLELSVPTPPSATDFYSMAYTFPGQNPEESFRITNWAAAESNIVNASYRISVKKTVNDVGHHNAELPVGAVISKTADGYTIKYPDTFKDDEQTEVQVGPTYNLTKAAIDVYGKTANAEGYTDSYCYDIGGRTHYFNTADLEALFANGQNADGYTITEANKADFKSIFYKGEKTTTTESFLANMVTDANGKFVSMEYWPNGETGDRLSLDLNIEEINDEQGFDAAMEEYNYKKMIYDRTIDDINTRTEIIQRQDQNLELHLKQLDTEQEAIKTEMDAVKDVIQKNVEGTFKTFA